MQQCVRAIVLGANLWLAAVLVAQPLRFQHLTTAQGLSDNSITCLFEDREGYIWIGTERGLNRYDGQRVERFTPGSHGPLGAHITSIAEDGQGRLWITTADAGLNMRDTHGRFTHFRHVSADPRSPPTDLLNHVLVLHDTMLIIASRDKSAFRFDPRTGTRGGFGPVASDDTVRNEWCHAAIRLDEARIALTALRSEGPRIVDTRSGVAFATVPSHPLITNCVQDGEYLFMAGWTPGLYKARTDGNSSTVHFPIDDEIKAMVDWDEDHLLAASKVNGLLLVRKDGTVAARYRHHRSDPETLCSDRTTCLLRDRNGNLWVGTENGLSVHAPCVWRMQTIPLWSDERSGDLVLHALQQDANGTLRVSTSKGFVLVHPNSHHKRTVVLEDKGVKLEVTGLFKLPSGEHFVGTETGVFRYDPGQERILTTGTGKWYLYAGAGMFQVRAVLPSVDPSSIILGALGYGHIAIDAGTGRVDPQWKDYPDQEGTMMLRSTVTTTDGTFWSATEGGVMAWRPVGPDEDQAATIYNSRAAGWHRLPGDDAQALAVRGDTVWVALRDAGAAIIVQGMARALVPPAHMPSDAIGVTVDAFGMVWLTTSDGLLRYDPRSAEWLHVPVNDGRKFQRLTKCITTMNDGRIAFAASDHLLLFDPRHFLRLPNIPEPRVAGLHNVWGELAPREDGTLELTYRNSAFDAFLTALLPTGAKALTFMYRLDSERMGQHATDASGPLRYAGVQPGTHRLLVRVRDAYGREGPEHALLTVRVIGPFWQRWWFFALLLAAGAGAMLVLTRLRQRQRARLQRVRDRIARDLHDDIGSTLGSISFYSEALRRKLSGSSDGMSEEVAAKIGSSSREMIDRMSDIVWSVDPKHDDAGALMERLQAFATDLLSAKDIALEFIADPTLGERKLTAEQRRNLFLLCKEALHNVVKYADAGKVSIHLAGGGQGLCITITDDGRGFDPENTDSYNGNGLANMRARAMAIHALFSVSSSAGRGTRVEVRLPTQEFIPRSGD